MSVPMQLDCFSRLSAFEQAVDLPHIDFGTTHCDPLDLVREGFAKKKSYEDVKLAISEV
jgi:hypothetical protein